LLAFLKFSEPKVHATQKLDSSTCDGRGSPNESQALKLLLDLTRQLSIKQEWH